MSPIRAVFLDFFNTVVRFEPLREQVQTASAAAHGVAVSAEAITRAYPTADEFLSRENSIQPVGRRTATEIADLWARYEQLLLATAGVDVDHGTASTIFQRVRQSGQRLALFDDVLPVLTVLADAGCLMGLVTNMEGDLDAITRELGIDSFLAFAVTSEQAGAAKPHAAIFNEALRRANVTPDEAVHVGDQPYGDVSGARGAGIRPVLIDRGDTLPGFSECPVIKSLLELPALLAEWNGAGERAD